MNIQQEWFWVAHHVWRVLAILGDIALADAVIKQVAIKRGYKKLASLCDIIANAIGFVLDVASGVIVALKNKNQTPTGG